MHTGRPASQGTQQGGLGGVGGMSSPPGQAVTVCASTKVLPNLHGCYMQSVINIPNNPVSKPLFES